MSFHSLVILLFPFCLARPTDTINIHSIVKFINLHIFHSFAFGFYLIFFTRLTFILRNYFNFEGSTYTFATKQILENLRSKVY